MSNLKTWPEVMYFQNGECEGVTTVYSEDATHCAERINANDVPYIHIDTVNRMIRDAYARAACYFADPPPQTQSEKSEPEGLK